MAQDEAQADGYYNEDEAGADEIDLSFLNEDKKDKKPAGPEAEDSKK